MTADLKPYPSYKPSGVAWLGEVPAHWEMRRVKHAFRRIVGGSTPSSSEAAYWDGTIIWVTPTDISKVTRLRDSLRRITKKGFNSCSATLVPVGSLVVTSRAPVGNVALAEVPLCTNQGCKTLVPESQVIDSTYGYQVFGILQDELQSLANGTTFTEISTNALGNVLLPIPPLAEQAAIVAYLDHTVGRIRRYLRSRERLIELLKEYRQAVVHEVVTRGLDPDVSLKPSGVAWLGEVPAHWEVRRLKHWVGINEAVLPETTDPDFDFRYLEIGAVGTGVLVEKPSTIRFAHAPSRARRIVKSGDTIISTVRTYLKAVWFAEEVNDALICSTGFAVLTPRRATAPKFVSYVVQNNAFTDRVTAESVGIAYPAIAENRFRSFYVCVPPLAEQAAIAAYLDKQTAAIDAAITRARREIDLLSEYRTRLIADVVTGQVDVREVAELSHLGKVIEPNAMVEKVLALENS